MRKDKNKIVGLERIPWHLQLIISSLFLLGLLSCPWQGPRAETWQSRISCMQSATGFLGPTHVNHPLPRHKLASSLGSNYQARRQNSEILYFYFIINGLFSLLGGFYSFKGQTLIEDLFSLQKYCYTHTHKHKSTYINSICRNLVNSNNVLMCLLERSVTAQMIRSFLMLLLSQIAEKR